MTGSKLLLTCRGHTYTVAEWEQISHVPQRTIRRRIGHGWPIEEAIFAPPMAKGSHHDSLSKITDSCQGCSHYKPFYWVAKRQQWYCDYINDTGKKRPCPPGPGCACYSPTRDKEDIVP